MNKLKVAIVTAALPFLLVWSASLLTGLSFNPRDVFQHEVFWGMSIFYWIMWVCLIGLVLELVEEKPAK